MTTELTHDQVAERLAVDGWRLTATIIDAGDYKSPSKWSITITRAGRTGDFTTEYSAGAAHRRWTDKIRYLNLQFGKPAIFPDAKPGDEIRYFGGRVTLAMKEILLNATEPTPPTIADVLYSLMSDAESVRHGQTFEEWCGDLGYDTDSRAAERMFNGCRDEWAGLIRLGADLDALSELFRDF